MKILKMSPYSGKEKLSSSHLAADLSEAYNKAGFIRENFAPMPSRNVSKEDRKSYQKYSVSADGLVINHLFPMFKEGKNPVLRALRYILVNIIQYFKGSKVTDADMVYSASTPPTQGVLFSLVKKKLIKKKKKYVPFIYNLQDVFPDSLVNAGLTHKGSLLWKIGRKMENYTYKNADRIIVIGEDIKQNILEKGVPEDKITVIPNWINTDKVYPVSKDENVLFDRYSLDKDKFYICYSGNVGHSQNLKLLLDTAQSIAEELPQVCFVIVGEGAAKAETEKAIADRNIKNVIMLPFQSYSEISHVFSLGDADLIISKSGISENSVPSKTWGIMASGRPIIASFDKDSALCKLIDKLNCGVVADADSKEGLVSAIKFLMENEDKRKEMGEIALSYVKENLNKDLCTGKYVETINQVYEQFVK